jgi:hypothetical protein
MLVHTFRGPERIFVITADETGKTLPAAFGPWTAFKTLEINRDEPQAGVNVNECLDDIAAHGFHLTNAHVRITDQAL